MQPLTTVSIKLLLTAHAQKVMHAPSFGKKVKSELLVNANKMRVLFDWRFDTFAEISQKLKLNKDCANHSLLALSIHFACSCVKSKNDITFHKKPVILGIDFPHSARPKSEMKCLKTDHCDQLLKKVCTYLWEFLWV